MAILRRKLTGRGIGEADRGHIHHMLQDRGLSKLQTLLAIVGICSTMAGACLLASTLKQDLIAVILCVGVLAVIVAGRIFGFHEMMLVFRHFEIFHTTVSEAARDLTVRRMVVHLEHADSVTLDTLWETIISRVESIGGLALELTCTSEKDEELLRLHWANPEEEHPQPGAWQLRYVMPRADGLNASFFASGHPILGEKNLRLDQLVQVFEACCRHIPSIEELRPFRERVELYSLPKPESSSRMKLAAAEIRRAA
jgi:hypothetical protein